MSKRQLNFRIEEETFKTLVEMAADLSQETNLEVTVSDVARQATTNYAKEYLKKKKK